ncbi:MAG TPA: serine hydrolase domain-containing protein [Candidatus Limnocylindrales bacterium]|nr:serine hydrolase domain-containing protein [Candidatus Limnocylindrales bacterium]
MKRFHVVLILLVATFALCATAQEQKLSAEKRAQIEQAVAKFMAATSAPGISVAVLENGEETWSSGFGMADLENFVPATPSTLYRLGSISKSVTATATMELWERGKLDLDAPVQKYCPSFPQKQWPITTRELLGHLGGIRHYRVSEGRPIEEDAEVNNTKHFDDPIAGGLQFFAGDPLVDQPGTKFHYSTQGYTLVGCAIEGASGEKYADFVTENVFRPARMNVSQDDDHYRIIQHRTRFYQKEKSGAVENADFLDSSYKIPGGGWLSSADDMAKFGAALLNDRLMKRATRDMMWTSEKTADGKATGYGFGWGIGTIDGVPEVSHSGGQQGTSTYIILAPERRAGAVVLINMEDVSAGDLGKEVLKIILGTASGSPAVK